MNDIWKEPILCSQGGLPYNGKHIDYWKGRAKQAETEIAKLRAALEDCIPYIEGRIGDPVAIVERANAALTNEQKP